METRRNDNVKGQLSGYKVFSFLLFYFLLLHENGIVKLEVCFPVYFNANCGDGLRGAYEI